MLIAIRLPIDLQERARFQSTLVHYSVQQIDGDNVVIDMPPATARYFLRYRGAYIAASPQSEDVWDPPAPGGYHSYNTLLADIRTLVASAPSFVSQESLGTTFEGRDIVGVRIKPMHGEVNKKIFLVGGHHARERISVEVPFLIGKRLVADALAGLLPDYVKQTEFLIVPMLNPDGHAYLAADGFKWNWRPNRSPQHANFGVDLNRNYPWQWGKGHCTNTEGSELYRGPTMLSELETQAVEKLFESSKPQFDALIAYHSFGQRILYPWASEYYAGGDARIDSLIAIAEIMAQASTNSGMPYEAIPGSMEYEDDVVGGELGDWAIRKYGIDALAVELPSDEDGAGFKLRANNIMPSFASHWPAIDKFFEWVSKK